MDKSLMSRTFVAGVAAFSLISLSAIGEETGTSAVPLYKGKPKPKPKPKPIPPKPVPVKPTPSKRIFVPGTLNLATPTPKPVIGKLGKRKDLPNDTLSSGHATLKGSYNFDFDTGISEGIGAADILWRPFDDVQRLLTPGEGAQVAYLGKGTLGDFSLEQLKAQQYTSVSINGSNDSRNKLVPGTLIGIKTRSGHYAKMLITSYGYDLGIAWKTFK